MTAPRRPRSAWLLVGSTASVWVKVQSAGQRLRRFLANCRWYSNHHSEQEQALPGPDKPALASARRIQLDPLGAVDVPASIAAAQTGRPIVVSSSLPAFEATLLSR